MFYANRQAAAGTFLVLFFLLFSTVFAYSGGSGTAEDPYQIADANDLLALDGTTTDSSKYYILTADIDLDPNLFPCGQCLFHMPVINHFTGTFDGNSHKITNLTLDGGGRMGFFGNIDSGGTVKNLGIENCSVSGGGAGGLAGYNDGNISNCYLTGSVNGHGGEVGGLVGRNEGDNISDCCFTGVVSGSSGAPGVGGLVGWNMGGISIINCHSTGTVSGNFNVGGLMGWNMGGSISNCYSMGTVSGSSGFVGGLVGKSEVGNISNCYSMSTVSSSADTVGGLVGYNEGGNISDCYSTGAVSGTYNIGGLVGHNDGDISNCYSTGAVSGNRYIGGLAGIGGGSSSIINCYSTGAVSGSQYIGGLVGGFFCNYVNDFWDVNSSGLTNGVGHVSSDPEGVTGKTTAEMKMLSTFAAAGWDFVDTWNIGENQTYPFLRGYSGADLNYDGLVNFADFALFANRWLQGD